MRPMETTARLLITCPDRPGIVAGVTTFLFNHGANITALDQHSTDPEGGTFFMRLEFQTPHLDLSRPALEQAFGSVIAKPFAMEWRISYASEVKRMTILVSKSDHALLDLLWRWRRRKLPVEVTQVISNHPDLRRCVEEFGVPFHLVPSGTERRAEAEEAIASLLEGRADVVVLARYMQIIINIHHSFLPAFAGARPYAQAHARGVKLIGATAHYVTETLDEGPIIEQDVVRVSHRHTPEDLVELGRDIERQVLARAVKWHLEDRVIIFGRKTVVFN
jgi:formyltetrahydrofolate deformylase